MSEAKTLDEWADRYGSLRAGGPTSINAWLGIPLIISALMGLLWSVPVPAVLRDASPALNYAMLFLLATFVYYCILSISLALAGFVFLLLVTAPSIWLTRSGLPLPPIAGSVFIVAFAWQITETLRATGRMQLIHNLQLLMLGPLWLLRAVYRKFGFSY